MRLRFFDGDLCRIEHPDGWYMFVWQHGGRFCIGTNPVGEDDGETEIEQDEGATYIRFRREVDDDR